MDQESDIIKDIQTLHSDMQTLVYENYNKFISATDTVRKVCCLCCIIFFIIKIFILRLDEDRF